MAGSSTEIGSAAVVLTANADGLVAGLGKAISETQSAGARIAQGLNATIDPTMMSGRFAGIGSAAKGMFGAIADAAKGLHGRAFGWMQRPANLLQGAFDSKGVMGGLQHIGGAVTTQLSGLASTASGLLTKAGSGIGFALGGPIGAAIGSAVGGAIGGLGQTIIGAIGDPFGKLDAFAKIQKQASTLGIAASEFQGLSKVMAKAGIEGDAVGNTFAHLGRTIDDATHGKEKAVQSLALVGLSAGELAGKSLDQSFLTIADAIAKLPPGAQQASAAVHIFGDSAAALLPELQKGSAGIRAFIDQQKAMGAVLSDDQIKAAADASKAWKSAKNSIASAWEGLQNRATLIAAPVIEFAGKAVSKAFALATPVFDWLGRALGQVADIATAVFEKLTAWVDEAVGEVKSWAAELGAFTGGWPTVEEAVVRAFRGIAVGVGYAWDLIKAGGGIMAQAAGTIIEQGGSIVTTFRVMVDLLKKLPENMKPSWLNGFIDGVDRADDRFRQLGTQMRKWGEGAFGNFGKSARDAGAWFDSLLIKKAKADADTKAMVSAPAPALSWQPAKLAAAIEAGSKEAYSLDVRNRYGDMAAPNKDAVHHDNGRKIDKGNKSLERIEKMLDKLGDKIGMI